MIWRPWWLLLLLLLPLLLLLIVVIVMVREGGGGVHIEALPRVASVGERGCCGEQPMRPLQQGTDRTLSPTVSTQERRSDSYRVCCRLLNSHLLRRRR